MAKGPNQKLKLLYLCKILMEKTDENHPLTLKEITDLLMQYGVTAERKSLYDDITALRNFGIDVVTTKGRSTGYYVAEREFQLPELKLLVDAIQSSKFITHKKTNELLKKLEKLCSAHQAQELQRQVFVANRIKTMNESIYYNIDNICAAIAANRQINFVYYEWTVAFSGGSKVERRLKRNGERYKISPWALTWDDEKYYLLAFDEDMNGIKHFRVDNMKDIEVCEERRLGQACFDKLDMALYSRKIFGMFGGQEELVQISFKNNLAGVVVDRFGKDIFCVPDGEDRFRIAVRVFLSPQFFGWLFSFGDAARLVGPKPALEKLATHLRSVNEQYEKAPN